MDYGLDKDVMSKVNRGWNEWPLKMFELVWTWMEFGRHGNHSSSPNNKQKHWFSLAIRTQPDAIIGMIIFIR